jgi:hypothetical protein
MSPTLQAQILKKLETLPDEELDRVLAFLDRLIPLNALTPVSVPGSQLLHFAGTIPSADLEAIEQALEADCE